MVISGGGDACSLLLKKSELFPNLNQSIESQSVLLYINSLN